MIAALFIERGGVYWDQPGIDPWDEQRDARLYDGPWPVIAHPPCQRWGRYHSGSPRKPRQYLLGDDGGCFAAALYAVRKWGGVLEHPAHSHAWKAFGLNAPPRQGGWISADGRGWTCHVEQGHYGHFSRKPTWLYVREVRRPELIWGPSPQRLPAYAVERYGYEKARRIGVMAAVGGKDKTKIRNATPVQFRDLLISIASNARTSVGAEAAGNHGLGHDTASGITEGFKGFEGDLVSHHAAETMDASVKCPSPPTAEKFFP